MVSVFKKGMVGFILLIRYVGDASESYSIELITVVLYNLIIIVLRLVKRIFMIIVLYLNFLLF